MSAIANILQIIGLTVCCLCQGILASCIGSILHSELELNLDSILKNLKKNVSCENSVMQALFLLASRGLFNHFLFSLSPVCHEGLSIELDKDKHCNLRLTVRISKFHQISTSPRSCA